MGRFIGIGVGSYDEDNHSALPSAVDDVDAFCGLLSGFDSSTLADPGEVEARRLLQAVEGAATGGKPLVLLWSGHALAPASGLRLADTAGIPNWLTVDARLLATARAWIGTATYTDEYTYLGGHPELLDGSADEAIAEALLGLDSDAVERYLSMRVAAQSDGVDAAYRPLLMGVLADEFVRSTVAEQAELLSSRRDDLLTDTVRSVIDQLTDEDELDAPRRATALLALARLGEDAEALRAMANPELFADLLDRVARKQDAAGLAEMATLALSFVEEATAGFYLAVALAIAGEQDDAGQTLATVRELDPERISTWINRLAEIGRYHPDVLPLITTLTGAAR